MSISGRKYLMCFILYNKYNSNLNKGFENTDANNIIFTENHTVNMLLKSGFCGILLAIIQHMNGRKLVLNRLHPSAIVIL